MHAGTPTTSITSDHIQSSNQPQIFRAQNSPENDEASSFSRDDAASSSSLQGRGGRALTASRSASAKMSTLLNRLEAKKQRIAELRRAREALHSAKADGNNDSRSVTPTEGLEDGRHRSLRHRCETALLLNRGGEWPKADFGTQARMFEMADSETQSSMPADASTQTDAPNAADLTATQDLDEEALLRFLDRVEPQVIATLKENTQSHAFDGYSAVWEEDEKETVCKHTLQHMAFADLQCTSVSWSRTGAVVGVAYGRLDHSDWCSHQGGLAMWNLDRRSVNANKADTALTFPSCVMTCAFHPEVASVIAIGTFHGEICIINTSQSEGKEIVATSPRHASHTEPVTEVAWVSRSWQTVRPQANLVSVAGDGVVGIWNFQSLPTAQLIQLKRIPLRTEYVPQHLRENTVSVDSLLGGTCASLGFGSNAEALVLGTEGGVVLKCNRLPLSSDTQDAHAGVDSFAYQPHSGPVYAAQFSPRVPGMFLTASMDGSLRLYDHLQTSPVLVVEPNCGAMLDAVWSPSRDAVVACSTSDGSVVIFDFVQSRGRPALVLEAGARHAPVYGLAFCGARPHLLAACDGRGQIKVYSLAQQLHFQQPREAQTMRNICQSSD
eukprot:m.147404 g.147404  ORF g.147404 m.147404 type:complete len:610 (+) comp16828_c0_seq1:141-1970(+)